MDKEKQAFERPCWDHDKHTDALAYERAAEMYMDELENEIARIKAETEQLRKGIIDYRHNGGTVLANAVINRTALKPETWDSILSAWREADKRLYALTKMRR